MSKKQIKLILITMLILNITHLILNIRQGFNINIQEVDFFIITFSQTIWFNLARFVFIPLSLTFLWWKHEVILNKRYLQIFLIIALGSYSFTVIYSTIIFLLIN